MQSSDPTDKAAGTADDADGSPDVITVVAPAGAAGERIDRFLAAMLETLSRSRIKGLIESGRLTCDGAVLSEPADPVRPGAAYVLLLPEPIAATPVPQDIPLRILFEDDTLIVLDKQAGLVTHPAPGNEDGTLVNALLAHCGDSLPGIGGERRPGIVHRLDKDTSGVMVVAKTESALAALSADFANRTLERSYLALVWGLPAPIAGQWSGAIGRDPRDRKRMAVVTRGGKSAATHYARLGGRGVALSLLRCRLETGRTHQIRVHAATAGHPLVGDPVYLRRVPAAAAGLPSAIRLRLLDFPRQALHAAVLGFRHPATGETMRFETPLPPDFASLLADAGIDAAPQNC
jgi:23S rRNA pseudouridine1911/1915/1917 synthase